MNKKNIALSLSTLLLLTACGNEKEYRNLDDVKAEKAQQEQIEYEKKSNVEKIELFINDELGEKTNNKEKRIKSIEENNSNFVITLKADKGVTVKNLRSTMLNNSRLIYNHMKNYESKMVTISYVYDLTDTYGNVSEGEILRIILDSETIKMINYDNFNFNDFHKLARTYFIHPAIK